MVLPTHALGSNCAPCRRAAPLRRTTAPTAGPRREHTTTHAPPRAPRLAPAEWFNYATFAQLGPYFAPSFFPASSPAAQQLGFWGAYAVAFVAQPAGALLFGHFGDRHSRKASLLASIALMGVPTLLLVGGIGVQGDGRGAPCAVARHAAPVSACPGIRQSLRAARRRRAPCSAPTRAAALAWLAAGLPADVCDDWLGGAGAADAAAGDAGRGRRRGERHGERVGELPDYCPELN